MQQSGILPSDTLYFPDLIPSQTNRASWHKDALKKVTKAHIVFVNPDKGIASDAIAKVGSKEHVYMNELESFAKNGNSLVIYHHPTRQHGKADAQIKHFSKYLEKELNDPELTVRALRFHRVQARFYFVVVHQSHKDVIENRLESFRTSKWCCGAKPHFTLYGRNGEPLEPLPCSP